MKLFLTEEKLLRAKLEAEGLLKSNPVVKILESFLGFCQSTLPAIAVAPLHFRNLQADMIKALKGSRGGQGYRSVVCLSPEAKKELEWWRDYVKMNNGKSILPPEEQDTIFSDASKQGWGAHLNLAKIGGRWNWEEKLKSHINRLELKAAFLALQAFLPQLKHQHVQIGIGNKTAMTFFNKLGGTRSHRLTSLALEMWNFAADRNLTLSAVYVPGEENQIADKKSRVFQESLEWMLHPAVFQALQKEVGCFSIDLFATRVNHQVPGFVSWTPEPGAVATDAFNVKWDFQLAYLFPPFCMIKRCLRKIQQDQAHCVLITPVWKSSPWYPVILSLLVGQPLLLPRRLDLLRLPGTEKIHPLCLQKNFRLAAWPFQGKTLKGRIFSESFRYPPLLLEEENCQSV